MISPDLLRTRTLLPVDPSRKAGQQPTVTQIMEADRDRLQVADAARREWEEAATAKAEAAEQARAELDKRGPARWDEHKPQPEAKADDGREV
jgi:hypothetical protein